MTIGNEVKEETTKRGGRAEGRRGRTTIRGEAVCECTRSGDRDVDIDKIGAEKSILDCKGESRCASEHLFGPRKSRCIELRANAEEFSSVCEQLDHIRSNRFWIVEEKLTAQ